MLDNIIYGIINDRKNKKEEIMKIKLIKRIITKEIFNEHMKNKLREDWRDFEKWKKEYPKCKAFFLEGRLFHVGERMKKLNCNID